MFHYMYQLYRIRITLYIKKYIIFVLIKFLLQLKSLNIKKMLINKILKYKRNCYFGF